MDKRMHDSLSLSWEGHVIMGYLLPQAKSLTYQQATDALVKIRHTDYRRIELVAEQLYRMDAADIKRGKRNLIETKGDGQEDISAAYLTWCTRHSMPMDLYSARMKTDNNRLFITEAIANHVNSPKGIEKWLGLKRRCVETNLCELASFGVLQKRYATYHDGNEYCFPSGPDAFLESILPPLSKRIYSRHDRLVQDASGNQDTYSRDSRYDSLRLSRLIQAGVLVLKDGLHLGDRYRQQDGKRKLLTDLVEHTSNGKGKYARVLARLNIEGFFDLHKTFRARDIDRAGKLGDVQAASMYLQDLLVEGKVTSSKDRKEFRNHRYLSTAGWDFVTTCLEFAHDRICAGKQDEERRLVNIRGESFISLTEDESAMIKFTFENPCWDAALLTDCAGYEFHGSKISDFYEIRENVHDTSRKLAAQGLLTPERRLTKDGFKAFRSLLAN